MTQGLRSLSSPHFLVLPKLKVMTKDGNQGFASIVSSDRSSCTDDGLLYIYPQQQPTFSDLEHLCLSILLQVSL